MFVAVRRDEKWNTGANKTPTKTRGKPNQNRGGRTECEESRGGGEPEVRESRREATRGV